jgi:hypothetical protein
MNPTESKTTRRYDGDLQMFCDSERKPDIEKLRFIRWLVEQGQLEHAVAGPPCGEYAESTEL